MYKVRTGAHGSCKRGLTLVELTVAMGLISTTTLIAVSILISTIKTWVYIENESDVVGKIYRVSNTLTQLLNQDTSSRLYILENQSPNKSDIIYLCSAQKKEQQKFHFINRLIFINKSDELISKVVESDERCKLNTIPQLLSSKEQTTNKLYGNIKLLKAEYQMYGKPLEEYKPNECHMYGKDSKDRPDEYKVYRIRDDVLPFKLVLAQNKEQKKNLKTVHSAISLFMNQE